VRRDVARGRPISPGFPAEMCGGRPMNTGRIGSGQFPSRVDFCWGSGRVVGARLAPQEKVSTVSERDGRFSGCRWATRLASLVTHWAVTLSDTVGGTGMSRSDRPDPPVHRCATTR
jgi:hypothetical protein